MRGWGSGWRSRIALKLSQDRTCGRVRRASHLRHDFAACRKCRPSSAAFRVGTAQCAALIAPYGLRAVQKLLHRLDKKLRLVVVHPMPGIIHHHDAGILEVTSAAAFLRVGGPAFLAV